MHALVSLAMHLLLSIHCSLFHLHPSSSPSSSSSSSSPSFFLLLFLFLQVIAARVAVAAGHHKYSPLCEDESLEALAKFYSDTSNGRVFSPKEVRTYLCDK